jgi:hypothetical protein
LTTPAAEVYQATTAVMTPITPPAFTITSVWLRKPIARTISVTSSVKNTRNTATFTRVLHSAM